MIERFKSSLRYKIGGLMLLLSLGSLIVVSAITLGTLVSQLGAFSQRLGSTEDSLRQDVVGRNLEGAAADIANDIDQYLLERIFEVQRWADLSSVIQAAQQGSQAAIDMGLAAQAADPEAVRSALGGDLFIPIQEDAFTQVLTTLFQQTERPGTPFLEIILTEAHGINVIVTRPVADLTHANYAWWQDAAAPGGGGIGVTEVFVDPVQNVPVIGIAQPVTDPNTKELLGVIRGLIRLGELQERISRSAVTQNASIKVFTEGGMLIADTDSGHSPEAIMAESSNVLETNFEPARNALGAEPGTEGAGFALVDAAGGRDIVGYAHLNGSDFYFASQAQLSSFDGFNWGVTVAQPEQRALRVLNELIQAGNEFRELPGQLTLLFGLVTVVVAVLGLIGAIVISGGITVPLITLSQMAQKVQSGDLSAQVDVRSEDEVGVLQKAFNTMTFGLRERERERDIFGRVVTPEVREKLLTGNLELGGETRWVSVLFSDIRSYSTVSEQLTPQELVKLLNEYLTEMNEAILEWGGYLNNYIGDAIVAVFGAPVEQEDKEWRAVAAALTMQERLAALNERRVARGEQALQSGIGISTGYAVAGQIGSLERLIYTVIGDAVNVAARLETLTTEYPETPLLFNGPTAEAIKDRDDLVIKKLGTVQVKGRAEPVEIYTVVEWIRPEGDREPQRGEVLLERD